MTHRKANTRTPKFDYTRAISLVGFLTIAWVKVVSAQDTLAVAGDTALFSTILRTAMANAGREELRVEPRPLDADPRRYGVLAAALAPVSTHDLQERTELIRKLGLRTADAVVENQTFSCPGTALIAPEWFLRDTVRAGCPKKPYTVVAVALPRRGTADFNKSGPYDRSSETAACGFWSARVIQTALGPGGSSIYAADYVLSKRNGAWTVVKVVGLIYIE